MEVSFYNYRLIKKCVVFPGPQPVYTSLSLPVQGRHLLEKTSQCLPCRGRLVSQATTWISIFAALHRGSLLRSVTSRRRCILGVSPRPILPQDKECFGSDTSHAEKVVFFFKESTCILAAPSIYFI
jgi:hypothetical protein